MTAIRCLLFACLALSANAATANPIEKVVELLSSLTAKVIAEGEAEQKQYEEFAEWCSDTSKEKTYEIDTAKGQAEDLSAAIEKASADIAGFEDAIAKHVSSVSTDSADLASAEGIRKNEKADYEAEHAKLSETIDTIGRAVGIIKRELSKGSFVQIQNVNGLMTALNAIVDASVFASNDSSKLTALIQQQKAASDDDFLQAPSGSPAAATYENHSGAIIDLLEDMLEKAETMKSDAVNAEQNANHNFQQLKQSLEDNMSFTNKELSDAKKAKAAAEEAKATAEGDHAKTSADLNEDTKYLSDVHSDCMGKASAWEASQGSRSEELKALATAKSALVEMTGGATSKQYGLLQMSASSRDESSTDFARVAKNVNALAGKYKDASLVQLAFRLKMASSAESHPFDKVKGLIQGMIEKLLSDAKAEAGHKAYCDEEMSKTKASIDDKTNIVEDLSVKIDKAESLVGRLDGEVRTLQSELAELAKTQKEMDDMRASEKAAFGVAKADFESGIEGVSMALKVLRDYYASSFLQQPAVSNHAAASGESTGIIGLLEVIESDFSKSLAEAEATESGAMNEYETMSQENQVTKATKQKDAEYKSAESKKTSTLIAETKDDRSGVQGELDAVLEYLDKLKPICIAKAEPYEERKARREAEIDGLKNALSILEGAASFVQKGAFLTRK